MGRAGPRLSHDLTSAQRAERKPHLDGHRDLLTLDGARTKIRAVAPCDRGGVVTRPDRPGRQARGTGQGGQVGGRGGAVAGDHRGPACQSGRSGEQHQTAQADQPHRRATPLTGQPSSGSHGSPGSRTPTA